MSEHKRRIFQEIYRKEQINRFTWTCGNCGHTLKDIKQTPEVCPSCKQSPVAQKTVKKVSPARIAMGLY